MAPQKKSFVWMVGVDFSLLLVGIGVIFAALRLRQGDDKSQANDIAQISVHFDLGRCFEWKWDVNTGGRCTVAVQIPDPRKNDGWESTCMPLLLAIQDADRSRPELRMMLRAVQACTCDPVKRAKVAEFAGRFSNSKKWSQFYSFGDFRSLYPTFVDSWLTGNVNDDTRKPIETMLPLLSESPIGLRVQIENMRYAVKHLRYRLFNESYDCPAGLKDLVEAIDRFQKNPKSYEGKPLVDLFFESIQTDGLEHEPLSAVLAVELLTIDTDKDVVVFTVETRSAGDSQNDRSASVATNGCKVEEVTIPFKELSQAYSGPNTTPIVSLDLSKRKATQIVWANQHFKLREAEPK